MTSICLISDTHTYHDKVEIPECDILIHAGDESFQGTKEETECFAKWLDQQPAKHIIWTPGNHSVYFEKLFPESIAWIHDYCPRCIILINEPVAREGINFFGSPFTPTYGFRWAYQASRTVPESAHEFKPFIGDLWAKIPENTNFIINHGMPYGILDETLDWNRGSNVHSGDREMEYRIRELPNLKYYVGGHLHKNGGKSYIRNGVTYFNAAVVNDEYKVVRKPILFNY